MSGQRCRIMARVRMGQRAQLVERGRGGDNAQGERRHPDSNRGVEVLQTSALPLGYAAFY
jgi:hypothetical protein